MNKIISFLQFFPLTVFLLVARSHNFTGNAWFYAFQLGAIAALIETGLLLFLIGPQLNRLISGVNLFLIVGGVGMLFGIYPLLNFMDNMREAGLIFFIGIVCILATLMTKTGIFEQMYSSTQLERKFSIYFLFGIGVAFAWSYFNRGNILMSGAIPLIALILFKAILLRQMQKR